MQSLAVSRGTSNGPDWRDLAETLTAFEQQNRVDIEITLTRVREGDAVDLLLTAKAWEPTVDRRVAKPLASQNVLCRAERIRTVEAVLFYLLYQLDFQLAEHEWESTGKPSA